MSNKTYKSVMAAALTVAMLTTGAMTAMAAGTGKTAAQTGTAVTQTGTAVPETSKSGAAVKAMPEDTTMDDIEVDEEMMVGMPSPIVEYDTLAEAEQAAGFKIQVPATITGYEEVSYVVISDVMIQVDYRGEHGDICVRKMAASTWEDISGDYNVYPDAQEVTVRGHRALIRGNGDTASLATWTNDGYAYSVGIYDENGLSRTSQGMSYADMQNLVYVVR